MLKITFYQDADDIGMTPPSPDDDRIARVAPRDADPRPADPRPRPVDPPRPVALPRAQAYGASRGWTPPVTAPATQRAPRRNVMIIFSCYKLLS